MPDQTRLLVVDDDADIRELLSAYLARYDMTVETAADGAGLFEKLDHAHFDLIILDIMLPGEDVLRRASDKGQAAAQSDIRRFAGWTLNVRSRELSQGDERIALSDAMYRLLLVFLDEPFAVLSREYLLRQTQGRDADVFDRSVDIQVSRLRGVLKDTGTSKIIKTVRGGGYMLSVDVEHDA